MPKRKYTRKRKRRFRRRKRSLVLSRSPVPTRMFTKLKYVAGFTIDPVGPASSVFQVSANGCYNPTTGGHQPRGFDQLMTMYSHYVVLGSRCKVSIAPQANLGPVAVGLSLMAGTSTYASINDYQEYGNTVWKTQGSSTGNPTTILTKNFSAKRFLGRTSVLSDSTLKGDATSNPDEGAHFHIWAGAVDGLINPAPLVGTLEIEYLVALIEPIQPTQS